MPGWTGLLDDDTHADPVPASLGLHPELQRRA
jgi:hypothetical protein